MASCEWIINESKEANFGDKRLDKRYGDILSGLLSSPNASIPTTFQSWNETLAAYRFFNHVNVNPESILLPHSEATLERIKAEKIVLIPQDTTEVDFTGRKSLSGMGYLSNERSRGLYLHPSIAFTPERVCLGVVEMQHWIRKEIGTRNSRKGKSIEEKETYCWLKGYNAANKIALAVPDTMVVSISDREGDIYEVLEKLPSEENKAYWLIRCQHDRAVLNEETNQFELLLKKEVSKACVLGTIEFEIPAGTSYRNCKKRHTRKARSVRQEIRICSVSLRPPRRKSKKLNVIEIQVVHCKEINTPEGEQPVEWFLITSVPIKTLDRAVEIVNWYLCRWLIEMYIKILKSGCKIEELRFETYEATLNCIAFYMIVAWRVFYLTMLGRTCPDIDCTTVFEDNEWQATYAMATKKKPPKKPPKLYEIILMIAKFGGHLGRGSDG
ncbi:IS4-like element ISLpn6 family transposase, partial [Legionella pneumophila]